MPEGAFASDSPQTTADAGRAVGALLRPGDVVLIGGEVGAGKTTFVRAACASLGVTDRVTSPSFTIGQLYRGRVPVAHIDLFRLENMAGEDPALLADYLTPDRVAFIEWPGAGAATLVEPGSVVLELSLSHLGGDRRSIEAHGEERLVEALRAGLAEP